MLEKVLHAIPGRLNSVTIIGAGEDADFVSQFAGRVQSWILVEGDPDAAARLASSTAAGKAHVYKDFVTPEGGVRPFHKFSWPFLNGPLASEKAQTIYPKLIIQNTIELPTIAFSEFLAGLEISETGGNLLCFDVPGQEVRLLQSLTDSGLKNWDWVALRGAAWPICEDGGETQAALEILRHSGFEDLAIEGTLDPFWPIYLLRRDAAKAQMQAELDTRASLLVAKAIEIHQQSERNKELESQNSTLRAERDNLANERDALSSKTTLLDVLTKGRVAQDEQMEKILSENESLTKERDTLLTKIQDLETQLAKLQDHAKLIDEEFGKAEGQLELIKDIFLRESLR